MACFPLCMPRKHDESVEESYSYFHTVVQHLKNFIERNRLKKASEEVNKTQFCTNKQSSVYTIEISSHTKPRQRQQVSFNMNAGRPLSEGECYCACKQCGVAMAANHVHSEEKFAPAGCSQRKSMSCSCQFTRLVYLGP